MKDTDKSFEWSINISQSHCRQTEEKSEKINPVVFDLKSLKASANSSTGEQISTVIFEMSEDCDITRSINKCCLGGLQFRLTQTLSYREVTIRWLNVMGLSAELIQTS